MLIMADYQRILILGTPGAGKSTLTTQLAKHMHLPAVRLDQLFWVDDQHTITTDELLEKLQPILATDEWIIDGNYASTLSQRLPRTQLVILLKVPRLVAIWRVIKRYLTYRGKGASNPGGNPDTIDWEFISYIWHFPERQGREAQQLLDNAPPDLRIITAKNHQDVFDQLFK